MLIRRSCTKSSTVKNSLTVESRNVKYKNLTEILLKVYFVSNGYLGYQIILGGRDSM